MIPRQVMLIPVDPYLDANLESDIVSRISELFPDVQLVLLPGVRGSLTVHDLPPLAVTPMETLG